MSNRAVVWSVLSVALQFGIGSTDAALITNITESGTGQHGAYTFVASVADGGAGLQEGSLAFVDRSYPWATPVGSSSIADYLLGLEYVQSRNDDKAVSDLAIEITFGSFARAYLFDSTSINVPVTGATFIDMGTDDIALDHGSTYGIITYSVRSAVVAAGDTITIGRDPSLMWGLAAAPASSVIYWQGDVGTGWNDGTVGVDTNWTDNTAAPGDQRQVLSGSDVVFTSAGTYTDTLDLGGVTYDLNSITIGQETDLSDGGLSDFGATNRILASNGSIRLGAGGITATMVGTTAADEARTVTIAANIELTADTTIRRNTEFGSGNRNRSLQFTGVISGGSVAAPLNLVIDNAGTSTDNRSIRFYGANTFVADVQLNGVLSVNNAAGLGDPSNTYTLDKNVYLQMNCSGNPTTENDFILSPDSSERIWLARFASGTWTINGNITDGHADKTLEILTNADNRQIVFAGDEQTFSNKVALWGGAKAIIAAADSSGTAWSNAGSIELNRYNLAASPTTDLLLRGDFTLNQDIVVSNITHNNRARLGQVNDGATSFDALFNGRINVLETDVEALLLTADAGGSATFTGEINVAGTHGLRKLGQGTVTVAGRVAQGQGGTTPVGTVTVEEGILLVNSPGGTDAFFATGIDVLNGAVLGGSGAVSGGDVTINSDATLAAGQSVGTFTLDGDLVLQSDAIWSWEYVNTSSYDQVDGPELLLPASGTITLDILGLTSDSQFAIHYGDEFTIFTGEVSDFDAATFNLVDTASGWSQGWAISTDNGLVLTAVPEPGTLLLLLAGGILVLQPRSWRRKHAAHSRSHT